MPIRQIFCTVADLIADMEKPGSDEARLYDAIETACSSLQKEFGIGWFIPVTQTTKLRGSGEKWFYPNPPVLALTGAIVNDTTTLVENTDYMFMRRAWDDGPYIGIEKLTDGNLSVWHDSDPDSVQIPCLAGLYNRSEDTSADVDDASGQTSTQTTLLVTDGGKVSPGMTLKIESEQQLVTGWNATPSAATTLNMASGATASDTEITVTDSTKVKIGEIIRWEFEQCRVVDKRESTQKLLVVRAWNNTQAKAHAQSTSIEVYRTVNVERGINGTTAATHARTTDIYRYHAPKDVNFLVRQIATLMINKARGNYAGKSASADGGTIFYHEVFPRYEIERIKQNYWVMMA